MILSVKLDQRFRDSSVDDTASLKWSNGHSLKHIWLTRFQFVVLEFRLIAFAFVVQRTIIL